MYMDENSSFVNKKVHESTGYSEGKHRFTDPGPAGDYVDQVAAGGGFKPGPVARSLGVDLRDPYSGEEFVKLTERCSQDVLEFYEVVRSQGDEKVRHQTLARRLSEARADPNVSNAAYRLLAQIASNSHGDHRYSFQSHEALAAACGMGSATNLSRTIGELIGGGYVARLVLTRSRGGWPVPVYAVRCSSEVRSGASFARLCESIAQAVAERKAAKGVKELAPTRHFDEMQVVEPTTWSENPQVNSSKLRESTRQNDDPNRDSWTCSTIDVEVVDRECASPSAQPPDEQPSLAGEPWPEDGVEIVVGEIVDEPRSKAKGRKKAKTAIGEEAVLSDRGYQHAIDNGWSPAKIAQQYARFKDHHLKEGKTSADWEASWRTWVGNDAIWAAQREAKVNGRSPRPEVFDWVRGGAQ